MISKNLYAVFYKDGFLRADGVALQTNKTVADSICHLPQSVDIEKERELERQARIEASLREREREVQKARSEQTKEIDREREQHKREEAIQHFKALMSDMV